MPPKKKAAIPSIVGQYDIELMTKDEMKMYVEALQEEHQRMRKLRNLYHEDKRELLNILKCIQDKINSSKEVVLQKDVEIQELMWNSDEVTKQEDQLNKINEIKHDEKTAREKINSFINIKTAEILHKVEEQNMMKDIMEKNREIHQMEYLYELLFVESDECKLGTWTDITIKSKDNFENLLKEHIEKVHRTLIKFSQRKIDTFREIFENDKNGKEYQFADFIGKMADYFQDIYWKNIKTKKEALDDLTRLRKELNTITLNLRDVKNENEELKCNIIEPISIYNCEALTPTFNATKLKTIEALTYENDLLTLKLKMVNKEYKDLKAKFISSFRRVHQKAIFKTLLLEKKLQNVQDDADSILTLQTSQ